MYSCDQSIQKLPVYTESNGRLDYMILDKTEQQRGRGTEKTSREVIKRIIKNKENTKDIYYYEEA